MSREKVLAEISVAELKDAGVKPPKLLHKRRKGSTKQNIADSTNATITPPTIAST